jgi:hypothetical protein
MDIRELQEPLKSWALEQREPTYGYELSDAFLWTQSKEGYTFWHLVSEGRSINYLKGIYPELDWGDRVEVVTDNSEVIANLQEQIKTLEKEKLLLEKKIKQNEAKEAAKSILKGLSKEVKDELKKLL